MEDFMGYLVGIVAIVSVLIGLPWLIFHYITRWKTAATLTNEDEKLMEELYDLARRLDDRMCSIERIMTAENPNWRAIACDPAATGIEDRLAAAPVRQRIGQ
ncbi:MAG TPA: envelope stress response membrane protein PspB [Allosphingosinicella sp.]|jgi:phage shock protein B